jgi:HTH-type transcriptional regulator/antitoxin HipB
MTVWRIYSAADFGLAIADMRRRQGLTQAQLAEQSGLTRDYLAHLETGRRSRSLEHIMRTLRRAGATVTVSLPDIHADESQQPTNP